MQSDRELLILILESQKEIHDRISDVEKLQAIQNIQLDQHMARSEHNEEQVKILREEVTPVLKGLSFLKTFAKIISWIAAIAYGIMKFFK